MNFEPYKLAHQMCSHGEEWADKNAAAQVLEELRHSVRSQISLRFLPDVGAVSKAEMMAEATQEYIDHIKSMVEARKAANRARVQYDADKAFIDLVRSQESSRRAEMQIR